MYKIFPAEPGFYRLFWVSSKKRRPADNQRYGYKFNAQRRADQLNADIRGECDPCGEPATHFSEDGPQNLCANCWMRLYAPEEIAGGDPQQRAEPLDAALVTFIRASTLRSLEAWCAEHHCSLSVAVEALISENLALWWQGLMEA